MATAIQSREGILAKAREIGRLLRSNRHGHVFLFVFALKLIVMAVYTPDLYTQWWIPFTKNFASAPLADPWASFASAGGHAKAFPYGPIMLMVLGLPVALKGWVLGLASEPSMLEGFVLGIPVLLADMGILLVLIYGFYLKSAKAVYLYWCSPVVFYINYLHGQLDVIPMFFLLAAMLLLTRRHVFWSAVVVGLGVACKENLLLALPFLGVFAFRREGVRLGSAFAALVGAMYVLLIGPFLGSDGYQLMVLGAEERGWIFESTLVLGGTELILIPLILSLLWLNFAMYRRANNDLLVMYVGLAFTAVLLFVPGNVPGWYLWLIPFFTYYSLRAIEFSPLALVVFSGLFFAYLAVEVPHTTGILHPDQLPLAAAFFPALSETATSVTLTLLKGTIGFIAATMYVYGVRSNEVYRRRRHPCAIGIGGGSGAGKDTFCDLVRAVLGDRNVIQLNGDDVHKWERGHDKWKEHTHLDPTANDLYLQLEQARSLRRGRAVVRKAYDHETGQFVATRVVEANSYVLVSGLHPFYLKGMRDLLDIKVFLDPEEDLRRAWKTERDTKERDYTAEQVIQSMEERRADRQLYIEPQREYADLVVRFCRNSGTASTGASTGAAPGVYGPEGGLRLECRMDNSVNLFGLVEGLRAVPGLHVTHEFDGSETQEFSAQGHVESGVLREVVAREVPAVEEIIHPNARFSDDLNGILQVVFLCLVSEKEGTGVN